jgi:acetyltransferase-like isoleucine patch superfamily enzyme
MIKIGKYSYGTPEVLWRTDGVTLTIGNFCSIANNVKIYLGGNHRTDWVTTYPFGHIHQSTFDSFTGEGHPSTKGNVVIGNDVWIGSNATIMSGVTISDGAVIAANSHVISDVEPYTIVGGNPAKYIKHRFKKEQIEDLLKIKWWYWDDSLINKFVPLLCNGDVASFIRSTKT